MDVGLPVVRGTGSDPDDAGDRVRGVRNDLQMDGHAEGPEKCAAKSLARPLTSAPVTARSVTQTTSSISGSYIKRKAGAKMAPNTKESMNEFVRWFLNVVVFIALGVLSWIGVRECERNDTQEQRLYAAERALVRIDYMASDVSELKSDMKKLLTRGITQ